SGASIYSASKLAREEFPDHDITVRGAVSIGRRLMDPLAELVKLDPKSIGVGQYQHDVDQKLLKKSLTDVVMSCVNKVGVEANTASQQLLCQVSGLNNTIATNMIKFRNENGPFKSKKEFLKVPRLGKKAFEQAAGFLRIHNAKLPLDRSGIHPESYDVVKKMAKDLSVDIENLIMNPKLIEKINLNLYVSKSIGIPTLSDILKELTNPGRDPRDQFENFSFDDTIHEIKDLIPGMKVPGIITNVTAFGAFVDIGVHQDGLVHISQMADRFVKDPNQIVKVRQTVKVTILDVDIKRKRISLSLKTNQPT
ncbi:MAG: S1 RNA-binding domain-containing protein, partial [Desulfobacteraceae bacterium]|nr:S1 RNA-binding domain-containing protein [Desulfobacteraceae bacterium]